MTHQTLKDIDRAFKVLEERDELLDKIRDEIAEYKDDQIIHAERNEIIDIVLGIIDKYREGAKNEADN